MKKSRFILASIFMVLSVGYSGCYAMDVFLDEQSIVGFDPSDQDINDVGVVSSMDIKKIAYVCYEANRAYCKSLGDDSQPKWKEAPEWQTSSVITGVKFHLDNPEAGDSASHESWMKHKVEDGWVYGAVKDPENKTHPCIVAFSELPAEQQAKDALFRSIVHALKPNLKT